MDCSLLFRPWGKDYISREVRLHHTIETIKNPSFRQKVLKKRLNHKRCDTWCVTPCEVYLHFFSAFFNPIRAIGLVLTFIRRYVEARLFGKTVVRAAQLLQSDNEALLGVKGILPDVHSLSRKEGESVVLGGGCL